MSVSSKTLTVATRKSQLALWQTHWVCDQLKQEYPSWSINILPMTTKGDEITNIPLYDIGGKALFVNSLEKAMIAKKADIAIHSMKDVPARLDAPFTLASILKRANPEDALVSNTYSSLESLPKGAVIGTCSVRRKAQLLAYRQDLIIKPLRGNIPTRLKKLDQGDYDAIIVAACALNRLGLQYRAVEIFPIDIMLPAATQGAIGIECLAQDEVLAEALSRVSDTKTTLCINAERQMVAMLNGNCQSPIAALATLENNIITLKGRVLDLLGQTQLEVVEQGPIDQALIIGERAAVMLLKQGARELL